MTSRGFGYLAGSGALTDDGGTTTIGYWEVRNGASGELDSDNDLSGTNGEEVITMTSGQVTDTAWTLHAGVTVTPTNPGYAILGEPDSSSTTKGTYFSYTGVSGDSQLTGVTTYKADSTFTTAAAMTTVVDNTVCVQYENYANGIEPGRVYAYITVPGSGKSAVADLDEADDFPGLSALLNASPKIGGAAITGAALAIGGASKHVFNEPVAAADVYPSFSIRVGREAKEHTFTGMVSTRLSLSANLNEYVMASVDWVGQAEETPGDIQEGVTFSGNDVDALHFSGAELYIDGSLNTSTKVQSITLEININRDIDSAYAVGANTIQRIPPSRTREITGSMEFNEIVYSDTTGLKGEPTYADLATSTTVHALHGGQGRPALLIKFQDQDDADHMEIQLYNVRFEAPEASVSGRDPARMSVNFQGFYDSKATGAAKAIQVKLKGTGLSTDAYA